MSEDQLGRKLTNDEKIQVISKWFKEQEYIDLLNVINVGSLSFTINDEDDETDGLNKYIDPRLVPPLDELINKTDTEAALEAVKSVLEKKQDRSRDCYRALYTLYCIKENKRDLYPILDQEILDLFHKEGKKPKQYEIYLKYHPGVDKESAEVMASTNLREFLNDIEICLKEKN